MHNAVWKSSWINSVISMIISDPSVDRSLPLGNLWACSSSTERKYFFLFHRLQILSSHRFYPRIGSKSPNAYLSKRTTYLLHFYRRVKSTSYRSRRFHYTAILAISYVLIVWQSAMKNSIRSKQSCLLHA